MNCYILSIIIVLFCGVAQGIEQKPNLETFFAQVKEGNVTQIKESLAQGIKVDARNENKETALIVAANAGNAELVSFLLDNKAKIDAVDMNGATALQGAIAVGSVPVVKVLLDRGANFKIANKEERFTYLMFVGVDAAVPGNAEVAKLLIAKGADKKAKTTGGDTALYFAQQARQQIIDTQSPKEMLDNADAVINVLK